MSLILIYMIIGISFSTMYLFRFGIEITRAVETTCTVLQVDMDEFFYPNVYLFVTFIVTAVSWPIFIPNILRADRFEVVESVAEDILNEYFDL